MDEGDSGESDIMALRLRAQNPMRGLGKSPEQLLADLEANPKENSITVKAYIGSLKSRAAARSQLSALRSFCGFHEAELKLNGLK